MQKEEEYQQSIRTMTAKLQEVGNRLLNFRSNCIGLNWTFYLCGVFSCSIEF